MSHEIYYTSAPQGLKRGSSGFCTVAASENIPKALWDRLETLSAYRHHFGVNAEGGGGSVGENPVSFAHWILNIAGKTSHVLSRVCDSGVDHTQRTNAFAHHLVMDHAEIAQAAGGPAWLLKSHGVMADRWDGRVGSLSRGQLPSGDDAARACRGWAAATGDAGWGGHLADLFVKSPTRPVCILFSPEGARQMLDLVAESIALLPPAARWNVTFNTYFTSMPTSATCLWRCCLAGTPAAQVGLRYAASGLVLDLTDRARLPALPDGAYVQVARTGQAMRSAAPAAKPVTGRPVKLPAKGPIPGKRPLVEDDSDDFELEEVQFDAPMEEVIEADPTVPMEQPGIRKPVGAYEVTAEPSPMPRRRTSLRRTDEDLIEAQRHAEEAAARRRKKVMYLFVGSLVAIGIGSALVIVANSRSNPPPVSPPSVRNNTPTEQVNNNVNPVHQPEVNPETQPQLVVVTNNTQPVANTQGAVAPVTVYPEKVLLALALERPNPGTGLQDRTQSFPLRAADLDPKARVSALRIHFPQRAGEVAGAGPMTFTTATGALSVTPEIRATRPSLSLKWRAPGEPEPAEALIITFDRAKPAIDFQWRSAILLRNPGIANTLYWLMQASTVELESPTRTVENGLPPQQVVMRPFAHRAVDFTANASTLTFPATLPGETKVTPTATPAKPLPAGWEATSFPDFENKDDPLRKLENASQVVKFRKTTSDFAWFTVTFRPGFARVESNYSQRVETARGDLDKAESDMRANVSEIARMQAEIKALGGNPDGNETVVNLINKRDQLKMLIDAYKEALAGYNEVSTFDVALEYEGAALTTLHFQKPGADAGK